MNDLGAPLGRLCLTLEQFRRTPEGRVRGDREMLAHFFPHDSRTHEDALFRYLPKELRGPILSGWKIRGPKTALVDDDRKVARVVHDALVSGDLDATVVEAAIGADLLVKYVPLASWWKFWRAGTLSERAMLKLLSTAYDLALFDAKWFLDALEMPSGLLGGAAPKKGLDVLAEGLTKQDLTDWLRGVHQTGDGSAKGLVAALGWEKIVRHTRAPLLLAVIDKLATKTGLAGGETQHSEPAGAADALRSS